MSFSALLNLAIGLTYLYLLLSLVASAAAELISSYWNLRGVALRAGVRNWLGDPDGVGIAGSFYRHALITGLIRPGVNAPSLKRLRWLLPLTQPRLPSYIPKETAADAVIDILARADAFDSGEMQAGLQALWRAATAAHPTDRSAAMRSFRDQVMAWFDHAMTRDGERYTLWSQYRLFAIGMFLAVSLNADTLKIASALWAPASIEQARTILETAEKLVSAGGTPDEPAAVKVKVGDALGRIESFSPPLGWGKDATERQILAHVSRNALCFWPISGLAANFCAAPVASSVSPLDPVGAAKWLGWLITALAISFGAQFWFDALGSFVRLRSGGVQPKSGERSAASKG